MTNNMSKSRHVFLELDAMRGVAAVCVMLYHFSPFLSGRTVLPSAYLAVDLFFILSGFIIAHAYQARLTAGLGFVHFTVIRLIRLYPLYIAGTALGLFYVLSRNVLVPGQYVSISQWVGPLVLSVLYIPQAWPTSVLPGLYPFDPAAWSLLFELAVNLIYGAACVALTPRRLLWLVAAALLGIVACVAAYGDLDLGMTRRNLIGGVARVTLSFFAGVYLYHLHRRRASRAEARGYVDRAPRFAFEGLMIILVAAFCVSLTGLSRQIYDTLCVLLLFPLLIWLGARTPSPRALRPLYAEAGRLSYAIYILHTPLLLIAAGAYKALRHRDPALGQPYSGLMFVVFTLVTTALMVRMYDEPVRRALTKMSSARHLVPRLARSPGLPSE